MSEMEDKTYSPLSVQRCIKCLSEANMGLQPSELDKSSAYLPKLQFLDLKGEILSREFYTKKTVPLEDIFLI